jgi:hypothetical protein
VLSLPLEAKKLASSRRPEHQAEAVLEQELQRQLQNARIVR